MVWGDFLFSEGVVDDCVTWQQLGCPEVISGRLFPKQQHLGVRFKYHWIEIGSSSQADPSRSEIPAG